MASGVYGLRLLARPRVRLAALLVVLTVVLLFRVGQFVSWTGQIQWGYDFSAYWSAAWHLLHGEAIYTPTQLAKPYAPQQQFLYLYPPSFAALLVPLAAVLPADYRLVEWGWTAVGAAIIPLVVVTLSRSEALAGRYSILEGRGRWLLVGAVFAYPPVVAELVLGNVHILILGLLALAWLGLRRQGHSGDAIAGLAIGLAALIKVFPGLLVLWLLLERRFRAAAWSIVGIVAIAGITRPLTGSGAWFDFTRALMNIGPPADTTDTLAPAVWLTPALGFAAARVVVAAMGLIIVVVTTLRPYARTRFAAASPDPLAYAIAVTVSVLVAPALYQHYLTIFVLPLLLGLGAGVRLRWLALAYLLMWGGQQPALGDLAWIVNRAFPTAGALVLLVVLVAAALESRWALRGDPDLERPQGTTRRWTTSAA